MKIPNAAATGRIGGHFLFDWGQRLLQADHDQPCPYGDGDMPRRPAEQPLLKVGCCMGHQPADRLTSDLGVGWAQPSRCWPCWPGGCGGRNLGDIPDRFDRWHELLRGRGLIVVVVIASFPSPPAVSQKPACRQKQKQKKPVRKGRGRPAFSHRLTLRRTLRTLLPDCPSSRLPSCFLVAFAAGATPITRPRLIWR